MNLRLLINKSKIHFIAVIIILIISACESKEKSRIASVSAFEVEKNITNEIIPAAENIADYFHLIERKSVGLVVNQTSRIGESHIVDSLLELKVNIKRVFAPEHGFRGDADAGEKIDNTTDKKTGLPLISLYGNKKKPSSTDLEGIDVLLFDIQDVGVRFYTFLSTLHYILEAAAENGIPVIVLDRPNPNGHYIDGPVLNMNQSSFVGLHPVPIVYGMTIGEYALMINGEGWLAKEAKADLTVVPISNYSHHSFYSLPVKPSPNLPNTRSIYLYPSLCLFEGTHISIGRGTSLQFQVIGHPMLTKESAFTFTPVSMAGAKYPKHEGQLCGGESLVEKTLGSLRNEAKFDISYLLKYYSLLTKVGEPFFLENNFFDKLAGNNELRKQIVDEVSETKIRESWKKDIEHFKKIRLKYLLYE